MKQGEAALFDERDLYTGLAALHWSTISDTDPRWDQDFYRQVIEANNGRALELGCGAGRLLLAYLEAGLQVVGADISGDMLAACRAAGSEAGLQPVLYEQAMQNLDVPGQFATIYIPCGSFVCVMGRENALETLRRCYNHLQPGGTLAFNVFVTDYDYSGKTTYEPFPWPWKEKAIKDLGDGRRLVIDYRETGVDPIEQIWTEERRYRLYDGETLLQEEVHAGQGHWYMRNELLWMLDLAGSADVQVLGDYTEEPIGLAHSTMVFVARRPREP